MYLYLYLVVVFASISIVLKGYLALLALRQVAEEKLQASELNARAAEAAGPVPGPLCCAARASG